jgi:hypothetical protein
MQCENDILEAVIEPMVLVTTEYVLANRKLVVLLEFIHMGMYVPFEDLSQLPQVLGHHQGQERVQFRPIIKVSHQKMDEFT